MVLCDLARSQSLSLKAFLRSAEKLQTIVGSLLELSCCPGQVVLSESCVFQREGLQHPS